MISLNRDCNKSTDNTNNDDSISDRKHRPPKNKNNHNSDDDSNDNGENSDVDTNIRYDSSVNLIAATSTATEAVATGIISMTARKK